DLAGVHDGHVAAILCAYVDVALGFERGQEGLLGILGARFGEVLLGRDADLVEDLAVEGDGDGLFQLDEARWLWWRGRGRGRRRCRWLCRHDRRRRCRWRRRQWRWWRCRWRCFDWRLGSFAGGEGRRGRSARGARGRRDQRHP